MVVLMWVDVARPFLARARLLVFTFIEVSAGTALIVATFRDATTLGIGEDEAETEQR